MGGGGEFQLPPSVLNPERTVWYLSVNVYSLLLVILSCVNLIRWDMSVEESVYTEKKARSLSTLREKSHFANKACHQHLGSIHSPLLNIELTKVVVDELHLLLRVTDVLI